MQGIMSYGKMGFTTNSQIISIDFIYQFVNSWFRFIKPLNWMF